MLTLAFITSIVVYFIYRFIKFWILDAWFIHRHFRNQGVPGQYVPIVGDLLDRRQAFLDDDPLAFNRTMAMKFGDYYYSSFGPKAYLAMSDPLLIETVLKTNVRFYHKSALAQANLSSLLGYENILLAEDEKHARHRRLLAPVFQHQNINSMITLMNEITLNFLNSWIKMAEEKQSSIMLDVHEEMTNLTLDIITGCVFGSETMKNQSIHETIFQNVTLALKEIEYRMFTMIAMTPIINQLPLPSKRRIDQSRENIKEVVQNMIHQRQQGLTKSACKGRDLLDLLLMSSGDDKTRRFTDEEICDEAITFVLAGHETTATLITWTLYNLVNNPQIYDRCQDEIDSVLDDYNDDLTLGMISLLTYTEVVIKESLRYHQPVPLLLRTAIQDNTIVASDGKHIHVKKGTDIAINLHILHRSETYWDEPNQFRPSRFDKRGTDTLLSFGAGSHSCIGQNFAMLEAKIMLVLMLKRFRFELVPGQKHTPDIAVTIRPKYGMWMQISPR